MTSPALPPELSALRTQLETELSWRQRYLDEDRSDNDRTRSRLLAGCEQRIAELRAAIDAYSANSQGANRPGAIHRGRIVTQ
jgi:hypothetical protein